MLEPGLLSLLAMATLTVTPNTEAPLERASRMWRPISAAQATAFASTASEVCYSGRKFGLKSNTLAMKACAYAQRYGPNNGYPAARLILCREERAAMEQTMLVTLRDEILGPDLFAAMYKGPPEDGLIFPNGSRISFRGLDQPRRIQGMRYGFAGCDQAEELAEEQATILDAGCTQVGMPWTQTFYAFNPEGPGHWAYQRFLPDVGDGPRWRSPDGGYGAEPREGWERFAEVIHVKPEDGLAMLTARQRSKLDNITPGTWRERLRFGKWVAFEGLVFDNWDPAVHIVAAPDSWAAWDGLPPPSWKRYRGIDFGYVHPYACVWLAESPEGVRYLYRQDLRTGLTIDEQVGRIVRAEADELARLNAAADRMDANGAKGKARESNSDTLAELYIAASYSDHEAGHRAMYAAKGIRTSPANKEVRPGIETLRMALQPRLEGGGPGFCVVRGSLVERDRTLSDGKRPTCFEEEASRWAWKTAKTAAGARASKDMPIDIGEDALKATIYVLHSIETRSHVQVWL